MIYINESILKFLGTDSGFGNNNTSAYIETDTSFTLIDCGFSVFNMVKNKFNYEKFSNINIIITHLHNDHAGSLSQFIMFIWFTYGKKVTVYSRCEHIDEYLSITGTPKDAYSLFSDTSQIKFIKTSHVKELDSYGFKLSFNGKNILYTGDTCTLLPYLNYINHVSEIYIDVSKNGGVHLQIDEIIDDLINIKNKGIKIIPIHMDDKYYIKEIFEKKNIQD